MKRKIDNKNYIILGIICIAAILITLFILKWIKDYDNKKMSISPLNDIVQSIKLDEINVVTSELNDVVLYIGYTGNKRLYISEERIKNYLNRHDFSNKFIYIDVTDKLDNKEYINIIKESLNIDENTDIEAPSLIYIKNKEVIKVISNQTGYLYTDDITKLNLEYNLEDK